MERDEDEMHAELNHAPHRSLFLSGVEWVSLGLVFTLLRTAVCVETVYTIDSFHL
jgi:hypothetical protein